MVSASKQHHAACGEDNHHGYEQSIESRAALAAIWPAATAGAGDAERAYRTRHAKRA